MNSTQAFYRLAYNREQFDCSVRALAVTCAVPYDIAHSAMAFAGRQTEGAATMWMVRMAACSLGYALRHVVVKSKTMRTLCRELKDEPGCFMAVTSEHVAGFYKGECIDWQRDRLTRIKDVFSVEK